ncbi:hypothetical protein [Rhizobium sp. MHM7A]|uniref:hypothetical protein n=1 Tax=Rhizobium sp. MHM7A TaxID=2583233 RepID=UPI001106AADF|nr:hypothetical protein [Rhizobium sp. MHM7A]TLX17178.1 hypothetical protein FFR93_07665 [Rhizobium sp. MHM7A]
MSSRFRRAFFLAIAAACVAASPSIARDARNAQISVDVISVTDNNPFKTVGGSLSKIPGVKATAGVDGDDRNPVTVFVLPAGENAQRLVERALSGFTTSLETSLAGKVPFGKSLPVQVGMTHSYVSQITSTVDDAGIVHHARLMSEVDEGFKMSLTPRMIKGKFVLDYKLDVKKLTGPDGGFQNLSIGSHTLQGVRAAHRSITQKIGFPEISGAVVYVTPGLEKNQYFVSIARASKA